MLHGIVGGRTSKISLSECSAQCPPQEKGPVSKSPGCALAIDIRVLVIAESACPGKWVSGGCAPQILLFFEVYFFYLYVCVHVCEFTHVCQCLCLACAHTCGDQRTASGTCPQKLRSTVWRVWYWSGTCLPTCQWYPGIYPSLPSLGQDCKCVSPVLAFSHGTWD